MSTPVTGVILAAGKARRIMPLSRHTPKPLLPVGNRPIVSYQIEQMREVGVERVHVVVGPHKDQVMSALGDGRRLGVEITYAEQPEPLGIAHALAQVADRIDEPFFVFLGDIFSTFAEDRSLSDMLELMERRNAGAVLSVKHEGSEEAIRQNFAVHEHDGVVTRVEEKPTGELPNDLRGCGIYLFRPSIFDAIARTGRSELRGEYEITDAIQAHIDGGETVCATSIVNWDMNITFPDDLRTCNLRHLLATQRTSIVGQSTTLHPECEVYNSVLGEGVTVHEGIRISDSVILNGTRIDTDADIERAVVGPTDTIVCAG